jgi:hypothetical protein
MKWAISIVTILVLVEGWPELERLLASQFGHVVWLGDRN